MTIGCSNALTVLSSSISKDICSLAAMSGLNADSFEIELIDVDTKIHDIVANKELDACDFVPTNENHLIAQVYKTKISLKEQKNNEPNIKLKSDQGKFYIEAVLTAKDYLFDIRCVEKELIRFINKAKLKNNILLGIFDDVGAAQIRLLADEIRNNKGFLDSPRQIPVAKGVKPVHGRMPEIKILSEIGKHENNGLYLQASKDKPLIYSLNGVKGQHGRDVHGNVISVQIVEDISPIRIEIKGAIQRQITDDGVLYVAQEDGHAYFDYKTIQLGNSFESQEISFHNGGDIHLPSTNLSVSQSDIREDAICRASVSACEIDITGAIGEDGVIKAEIVKLDGQSNKYSRIYAKKATLKYHKGCVEADEVYIENAEPGGKVNAKVVEIDIAIGAIIRADYIQIKELKSGNHLFASREIVVDKVTGSNNTLIIENGLPQDIVFEIDDKKKLLQQIRSDIDKQQKAATNSKSYLMRHKENIKIADAEYAKAKEKKLPLSAQYKKICEQIALHRKTLSESNTILKELNEKEMKLREELDSHKRGIFDAEICVAEGINTHENIIKFISAIPQKEIIYKPIKKTVFRFFLDYTYNILGE